MKKEDYFILSYERKYNNYNMKNSIRGKEAKKILIICFIAITTLPFTFFIGMDIFDTPLAGLIISFFIPIFYLVISSSYKVIKTTIISKSKSKKLVGNPINLYIQISNFYIPIFIPKEQDICMSLYDNGLIYNIPLFQNEKPVLKSYYQKIFFYNEIKTFKIFSNSIGIELHTGEKYLLNFVRLRTDKDYIKILRDKLLSKNIKELESIYNK